MGHATHTDHVDVPPDRAFALNLETERIPGWVADVVEAKAVSGRLDQCPGAPGGDPEVAAHAVYTGIHVAAYQRIWGLINAGINGRLDAYRAKTSRQISLVAMVPILGEEPTGTP